MELDSPNNGQNSVLHYTSLLKDMPEEILEIIRLQKSPHVLDTLSTTALDPSLTLQLFTKYESVFADTCARWISHTGNQKNEVIESFARILPLAPHLSSYLQKYLETSAHSLRDSQSSKIQYLWKDTPTRPTNILPLPLQRILLATFRLLDFDKETYGQAVSGSVIQDLFQHGDRAVRYLAVRVFCQLRSTSDFKLEQLLEEHVGKQDAVLGDYDDLLRDYGFLHLFEQKRLKDVQKLRNRGGCTTGIQTLNIENLSPLVTRYSSTLLPRPNGVPSRPSTLITTSTTSRNMETFAKSLLTSSPVLLHGLAGSGKTSLVNDFARELGFDSDMVTLHLNEQTDAKMLIGMYASGSTPGSFTWRAGVLTTAVREGRWIFIEDLDRAPNEVISVILPLIERGELLIPSRGETIKAGPGFRLLASIRTSLNVTGTENPPALHMLGARLWHRVAVQIPTQDEFREIIDGTYPILHQFLPGIINVYDRLCILSHKPSFASKSRTSLGRPISLRDLLKWCRRLDNVLELAGGKTGQEPISETTKYEMFLEATDCFAGSLQTEEARRVVISCIAEEMHIAPQRVEHFLTSHIPRYEDGERELVTGRARLSKRSSGRISKPTKKARPFANTNHAKRLLEQVGVAVRMAEPVLLVGETGIGKTTVIQQLADSLGFKLTAVNLSQQSEVGDLLGGFKPVNIRSLAIPLKDEFDDLFAATGISASKNQRYVEQLGKAVAKSQWSKASRLWREAPKMFETIVSKLEKNELMNGRNTPEQPTKRRKTESKLQSLLQLKPRWQSFSQNLDQFDIQLTGGSKGFAFTFIEGNIVKAARNGDWVLLDEINLASPDTLESIADLLHSGSGTTPSILLSETGEMERVRAHPNFRIFGAMNPATDVGKRDLPMGLRSRFTEIYVESPDRNFDDLLCVIKAYLKGTSSNDDRAARDVAKLYLDTKRRADEKQLVDGANQVPHFSLRTLTRVLSYVTEISPSYGLRRSLYEGFAMGFLTLLNKESEQILIPLINHHLLDNHGNPQALLAQTPRHPEDGRQYVPFTNKRRDRQYWMLQGSETPQHQPHYIITPFVERNMLNLVRATSTRRFPVLVQGPTSSGKTSMIEYLAKHSGNKFVRINNHEHTDLQEYLGTYVSGSDGQLRFQEGLLVQALRQGHWIVLDELNLAPTDVLEALNRLLDDNRELLIPETQEIVRPHENFMLFATQNPPGLYGGRKTLSRAFRNRFLELHFDDIPENELHIILEQRSQKVAPSDCQRIVSVYKELSRLRQSNRLFEQKDSFATLRDLFRWALRGADNREQLAANGYMLLGERVRNAEERLAVKKVIETVFKVKIDPATLYDANLSPEIKAYDATANTQGVVWTSAIRRLYVLVSHALRNNEPVLLVGETGCGKTTVCQMLADAFGKELSIVNAHQNTETGDLIGAQRPVRNRAAIVEQLNQDLLALMNGLDQDVSDPDIDLLALYRLLPASDLVKAPVELCRRIQLNQIKANALFEWSDGSLVQSMKDAQFFLLDEISLADDSVLERLNSVLESQRTLLLAEKGIEDSFVQAADGFQFFATMNPGGDYGKRELSPALRNRFTEIWVPSLSEHEDILLIVRTKLNVKFEQFSKPMVLFAEWFGKTYRSSASTSISVRDVLAWVTFINGSNATDAHFAVLHGASMVYIDTLGANPAALLAINPETIREERANCLLQLGEMLQYDVSAIYSIPVAVVNADQQFSIGNFSISKQTGSDADPEFAFDAPTTKINAMRVLRALQVQKPILIEGSPGVGKTTLVAALARACGKPLTRINLSEQTDLMDLFGSDVPVEGAEAGHFAWRDAPFLQAMQAGGWVLLDEMNLASQSVLEGLNACLDHRGEVYISELDQTFKRHPNFSVFAAQNPHHQGGGRKGLPASFVNRFTVVYADVFRHEDLELICRYNFPSVSDAVVATIIHFVSQLEQNIVHKHRFGSQGGPWEFNLRDILRWLQLLGSSAPFLAAGTPPDFLNLIFRLRFRTSKDRQEVDKIFAQVFGADVPFRHFFHNLSPNAYQVGMAYMTRSPLMQRLPFPAINPIHRLPELESIMICVQQNLPCILVGTSGSGKTTLLEHVAAASGKSIVVFPLNADIDTMDLVGGFEQVDPQRSASAFLGELGEFIETRVMGSLPAEVPETALEILSLLGNKGQVSSRYFGTLSNHLLALEKETSMVEFKRLAETCKTLATTPMTLENARFEWVDGVLVKALEQGKWLVLDNANLCSASVLDRLNSLLEPNGSLSINEHCGPNGEPKIVKPHPDFRIFLTMDARFGELSRAMRNRAIEIFLQPLPSNILDRNNALVRKEESSMQRYYILTQILETPHSTYDQSLLVAAVGLDNLAWNDIPLLSRYANALQEKDNSTLTPEFLALCQQYAQIYEAEGNQNFRTAVGEMLGELAAESGLPQGFRDAQIIHPLQNSPLVPLVQQASVAAQVYWFAFFFEMKLGISKAWEAHRSQECVIETIKPSRMNRLQRSLVSGKVQAVAKDSTVRVSDFLVNTLRALDVHLQEHVAVTADWEFQRKLLNSVLQFWWDTYHLATSPSYEEAIFQAHLAIGNDLFTAISETMLTTDKQYPIIEDLQSNLKAYFDSGFKLTTGLSMELLWKRLRPTAISKQAVMHTLLQMEHLAVRFDALRWKASISVEELGGVMTSLVQAYKLVLTSDVDGHSLVQTLNTELEKLEASIGSEDTSIKPFLEDQFESLRQFQLLETMQMLPHESTSEISDVDTIVLANYSTTSNFRESAASETSTLFQGIDSLWGSGNGLQPIMTTFSENLLHRLNAVGEVDLRSLKLLESELPIMGQKLAASTRSLGHDQILLLNHTLSELIAAVINFHGIRNVNCLEISHRFESSLPKSRLQNSGFSILNECASDFEFGPAHLANVLDTNFRVAFIAVEASKRDPETRFQYSALAWVQFAVGAITLYVPDRTFDPDKKQRIARERHVAMSETLKNRLFALKEFEQLFTNQSSNLRCQLLKQEISELGEPAEVLQEIYRPEVSEMDQLQGEFKNLLKTIVYSNPYQKLLEHFTNGDVNDLQEITLMQNNVLQIVRRLTERFREYSDLIVPVVNILRCMQIGLSLAALASKSPESNSDTRLALSRMTPFLGGHPLVINESLISSQPMEFLGLVATTSAIEPVSSFDPSLKQALMKAFHGCYEQWSKRLEFDRQDQESKSGLYRFRGSAEDEEEGDVEQFNELFPAYDDDSEPQVNEIHNPHTARDTAVRLSNVHSSIFLGGTTPSESMLALIRQVSHKIGALHNDEAHFDQNNMSSALLPGALLILDDHAASLSSSATISENYNFYADANLPETRKLVSLIHQIQSRFRELKAVDEIGHMQPLEDVLVSCQELLQFRHTEPLAKIITKVEKVHTFIHEWQFGGWASRANSALTLYDNITSTIVNWRRLELSTWAKLFDMETSKCDDDAKSWWFVAYQVVVAAPLSNSDSIEELKSYAQKLLKDLETYFSTAIMGQFVQRLRLLKQLQKHLEVIALEVPSMSIIHGAVANFIALYARYEKPVQENLKRGRVTLEKAMRDVLLLASWKDANIVALRDSAKRSHHKLFKIVRKFRSLLGQPMEFVLKAGLPDETLADSDGSNYTAPALFPTVDLSALALCARTVPNWPEKSKRFINVSKTVSIMADAGRVPESAVEGSAYLDSFLANIITSTAELQKATPSILTDDNKMKVKHLKSQKRKLFADTLKDLRQMGIKYNLGANALSKQDSLSIVLASVEPLNIINQSKLYGLEYYFHKSVDLAPRARAAAQQHSEDLSSAEVARSTGFLEGLVQVILSQRNTLSSAVTGMSRLDSSLRMARALWAPEAYGIRNSHQTSNQKDILCWLPNILIVCLELIKTHAKLGNFDNTLALDFVTEWMGIFDDYAKHSNDLPTLPSHIISTKMQKLEGDFAASIHLFSTRLVEFSKEHPDLSFILDQVMPWIKIKSTEISDGAPPQTISILDQKLSTICDAVFVAIEKYKNTLKDLPASTEEPNWLVQYDTCLSNSIKFLHCPTITSQVEDAFKILRRVLSSGEHSSEAGAVFAVALPILQQYSNILQEAVSRYAQLHRATCKTSFVLAKTFTQIASQGFCTPSEKQDAQDGKTEKLEGGTGLGEGEGAEDISKDIQDDENLDELAQEPDASNKEDMEDEKDAVDMADGEMEGEMQDGDNKGDDDEGSGDEEDGEDMDDEAGDVDDLDPNAIDEKMWDGDGKEPEKDQEGDESKGKQNKDEQVAAQENDKEAPEGGENSEEEEVGAEQGEEITQQDEVEKHDPHAQEGDALDLPEDMELDGDEEEGSEGSDNGMDNLSDVEDVKEGEQINDGNDEPEAESMDPQEDQNMEDEMDIVDLDEENEDGGEKTEEAGENTEETPEEQAEDQEGLLQDKSDDASADPDNAVPSNVQGIGEDQDDNATDDKNESSSRAQRDDGGEGGDSSEQKESAAEDGEKGRQADGDAPQDSKDETQDSANAQPFKKLGDALESWHRQQTQIREAPESREQGQDQNMDMNVESSEFQHLQDEDAEADTQAMGTATEEQAHALDESMAVDPENNELPDQFQADDADEKETERDDVMDLEDPSTPQEQIPSDAYEGRVGASINQAKQDRNEDLDEPQSHGQANLEEDVEEVDRELESTHLVNPEEVDFRSAADARLQWTHYEAQTRDLSLSLTEQLRLILAPTLATKMRGDFRTGKRLNIKRIIPYIASQYKRDKIWMRRSVPSKRSYQIMLAVDDSKSMGESGSGSLAFETLVMVSKSLSMLEVGEICVVGFGEDVRVAHDFDTPFSSDAGPKVFQNFAFEQKRTDVTKLVRESIELFRSARAKASSSPTDLWQMELIISDGVCDSSEHEPIRRLLREALEERIMMVFVIVDDVRNKKKGESVMDLKEAKFVKDEMTGASNVKIERYLDTFPFQYYLIVSDVKELPGVLATLLRQWFAEVVDSSN